MARKRGGAWSVLFAATMLVTQSMYRILHIAYRVPHTAYCIPWRARALFKLAYAIALVQPPAAAMTVYHIRDSIYSLT